MSVLRNFDPSAVRRLLAFVGLLLSCLAAGRADAQDLVNDGLPPSIRWRTIDTPHFRVHFHPGAERSAQVVARVASDVYGPVTSFYDHEPNTKIDIVLIDYEDDANGSAFFFDNKIEIWAPTLDFIDFNFRGTHNWLRNVITHEFTHIVQIQTAMKYGSRRIPAIQLQVFGYESVSRPDVLYGFPNVLISYPVAGVNVPAWFAEGVAQFERPQLGYETWDSHRDMLLRTRALEPDGSDFGFLSWNDLGSFGKTSLGSESVYNAGFAFSRYLAATYGEGALAAISRQLSRLTSVNMDIAMDRALGKPGHEVYRDFTRQARADYESRTEQVRAQQVIGDTLGRVGFSNLYPVWAPSGDTLYYVSTQGADYLGQSSLYRIVASDSAATRPELIRPAVRSALALSPDGRTLVYARRSVPTRWAPSVFDLFGYDLGRKKETRLTHGLRAQSPTFSPDGAQIAFLAGKDGITNLYVMSADGSDRKQLTDFSRGEQVFTPKWSPDGARLVFAALGARGAGRDLYTLDVATGRTTPLVVTAADERDPAFSAGGDTLIYASDRTGIFNLYALDLRTGRELGQITNVIGGAFMPAANRQGELAYALFTASGYKLARLRETVIRPDLSAHAYRPLVSTLDPADPASVARTLAERRRTIAGALADSGIVAPPPADAPILDAIGAMSGTGRPDSLRIRPTSPAAYDHDWAALRAYDDSQLTPLPSRPYRSTRTTFTVLPAIRFDTYTRRYGAYGDNLRNGQFGRISGNLWRDTKVGAYLLSGDVLGKLGLLAGLTVGPGSGIRQERLNPLKWERDGFLQLDYHGNLFGLPNGATPTLSFQVYHQTRNAEGRDFLVQPQFTRPGDVGGVFSIGRADIIYTLTQADLLAQWRFNPVHRLGLRTSFSFYSSARQGFNAKLSPIRRSTRINYLAASSDRYFLGRSVGLEYGMTLLRSYRNGAINPVGRTLDATITGEQNELLRDYKVENGALRPLYQRYTFPRFTLDLSEHRQLPLGSHTLTARLWGGAIVTGDSLDSFFNLYATGMFGMRGYPFYALGGSRMAAAQLTYRFPIVPHFDAAFLNISLAKLYGSVFADVGNAWSGATPGRFKRDIGAELRLEAWSFYLFPTRLFVSGAYGLDTFTVQLDPAFARSGQAASIEYGHQVQVHLGLLFDFDLRQDGAGKIRAGNARVE